MLKVDPDTTREQLLDQVFAASTLAEIAAAEQALHDWLAKHPDEPGMADAFELLAHQEEFARADMEVPCKPEMSKVDPDTTREQLLDQVFAASTLAEIAAAEQALHDWLAKHPDEPGMADAFELLAHQGESARRQEEGPGWGMRGGQGGD